MTDKERERKLNVFLYLNRMSQMDLITWTRIEIRKVFDLRRASYRATLHLPDSEESRIAIIHGGPPAVLGIFKPNGRIDEVIDDSMIFGGLDDLWVTASYKAGDKPLPKENHRFMDEMMKDKPWDNG